MARLLRELGEAERLQLAAHGGLARRDAEFVPKPLDEIDQPPADDAIEIGLGAGLNRLGQRRALLRVQERRLSGRLAVDQPARSLGVEEQHPVVDDLQPDAASLGRLRSGRPVVNRRQRQQALCLLRVSARLRQPSQFIRPIVRPKLERSRHEEPPLFSMVNHIPRRL